MELLRRMEPFSLFVMLLGALDWGILGLFNTNLFAEVFGTGDGVNAAYTVVGLAGLVWLPRLMEMFVHADWHHRPRAHGA
jgi:uncharacterized membrane protein YuzA (DUF378 family)